jgi:drug/metabolite transporter (DMT)-like permease
MTAMHAFFYALTHMPLADCIFIGRVQPLLLALFAPLVLGESAPRSAWFAIATGLAGVGLVMTPGVNWSLAGAVAFGGAALSAGAHMLVRRLNRTDQPLIIVFNFIFLTGAISGVWSIPNFVPLTGRQWLLISGVAFFASLGQMLMTLAYRRDQAPAVAAASYSSVILSVFYGAFFWNEMPGIPALAGAALILTGGLFLIKSRFRVNEPASPP